MPLSRWYVSRGRIDRSTYWLRYALPLFGLAVLALLADVSFGYPVPELVVSDDAASVTPAGPFLTVVSFLTVVPSITSAVTRLHDRGRSAWWLLLGVVPYVGGILLLVQVGFLAGEPGPNRYGPPPSAGRRIAGFDRPPAEDDRPGSRDPGPRGSGQQSGAPRWLGPEDDPDWGRPPIR